MPDTSKYKMMLDEIAALEKAAHSFVGKNQELIEIKKELEEKVARLQSENKSLVSKIKELEEKTISAEDNIISVLGKKELNENERENLKSQIDELIEKIDYHIHSL